MKILNLEFWIILVNLYIACTVLADGDDWDTNFENQRKRIEQRQKDLFGTEDPFDNPFFKNGRDNLRDRVKFPGSTYNDRSSIFDGDDNFGSDDFL